MNIVLLEMMVEVHGTNLAGCLWQGVLLYFVQVCLFCSKRLREDLSVSVLLLVAFILRTNVTTMAGSRFDVLATLDDAKARFFYKTMTSMLSDCLKNFMALELPSSFANEHGEEMIQDAALVRPTYGRTVWWLRFDFLSRVYTFGGGWRDFVLDNGINIGEFLVFELVDRSRLVVHVYPRDDKFGHNARGFCRSGGDEYELLNPGLGDVDEDRGHSRLTRSSSPSVKVALEYGFRKTIRSSHTPGNKGS